MKICETKEFPGGLGGGHQRVRVVVLDTMPKDDDGVVRFRAASDTEPFDWTLVSAAPVVQPYSDKDTETAAAVNAGAPVENPPAAPPA